MIITRQAEGIQVDLSTSAWPRRVTITHTITMNVSGRIELFGMAEARALHWALGEVIAADPEPDDRPRGKT